MFAEKERAQVTLQSIGDAVITTDRDGCIDYLKPVAERLTGWSSVAACGERLGSVMRLLDELTEDELDNPLARCLREGQVVHSNGAQRARQPTGPADRHPGIGGADPGSRRRDRRGRGGVSRRDQGAPSQRALSYQAATTALTD